MPRKLKLATVQMDATPAPTSDRLERAAQLVADAAAQGAQLIVLPELFNIGYEYHERNYGLAEPITGQTMTWMKAQTAQHKIHLAGSFLLLDDQNIFNSAFIVAPDGHTWRYDKIYPYQWERAYFREGSSTTVADTDLGKFGMMICWDAAHPELWQRYAGNVDAMVISSCPPSMQKADLVFPNGERFRSTILGSPIPEDAHFQDQDVQDQAGWMHVPVVTSQGAGKFRSKMPLAAISTTALLKPQPDFLEYVRQAQEVTLETGYERYAKIIASDGQLLARVENDGDGFAVAEVTLADTPPQPTAAQPEMRLPEIARFIIDVVGVSALIPTYRAGVRRQWGEQMAQSDPRTKAWTWAVAGMALIGVVVGFGLGRRR